jgi:DNA-binding transcriptional ArsR family regulator
MKLTAEQVVEVLRAAGESTRLRLLALLAAEELSVLELCRILDQSQPRVSRHLKLLAEAGLVERFPDGAWVFYRLAAKSAGRFLVEQALDLIDDTDPIVRLDADKLSAVRAERSDRRPGLFRPQRRALERDPLAVCRRGRGRDRDPARDGRRAVRSLVDLGAGTGRMLTLLGKRAANALGLDLSQQMLNIARDEVDQGGAGQLRAAPRRHLPNRPAGGRADLVTVHQVLHYLGDPANAVAEAARLVTPGGLLLIADFAPHDHEFLREAAPAPPPGLR